MNRYAGSSDNDDNIFLDRDYSVGGGVSMENTEWDRGFGHQTPSYYGVGPKGWHLSDEKIRDNICEALARNIHLDASGLEVEVSDGVVHLKGEVNDKLMKREAEKIVNNQFGVKDYKDEITLRHEV